MSRKNDRPAPPVPQPGMETRRGHIVIAVRTAPDCPHQAYTQAWEQFRDGQSGRCYQLAAVSAATQSGFAKRLFLWPGAVPEWVAGYDFSPAHALVWEVLTAPGADEQAALRLAWAAQTWETQPWLTRQQATDAITSLVAEYRERQA